MDITPQKPTASLPPHLSGIRPRAAGEREVAPSGGVPSDSMLEYYTEPGSAPVNRQLYKNSSLSGSSIEQDAKDDACGMFNAKDPNFAIQHEKPEHRMAVYLKAQGKSNREIAKLLGYTEAWVSQIIRQPWARVALLREMQAAGRDAIQTTLEGAALDSVLTVISIRDDLSAKQNVRLAAADSLLDRFLGKPTQRVEQTNTNRTAADSIDGVNRELEELAREEARLTGKSSTN